MLFFLLFGSAYPSIDIETGKRQVILPHEREANRDRPLMRLDDVALPDGGITDASISR